jgi:DHA1 family inner membrane transport protein
LRSQYLTVTERPSAEAISEDLWTRACCAYEQNRWVTASTQSCVSVLDVSRPDGIARRPIRRSRRPSACGTLCDVTETQTGTQGREHLQSRLPRKSPLLALAGTTFTQGVNTFVMAGVLRAMSEDLDVSVAMAGQVVTVFGIVYAISAPLATSWVARMDRRRALIIAMAAFSVASVGSALASSYEQLIAWRMVAAVTASVVTPIALAAAGEMAEPERAGRAVATVLGGFTVALVLGVPLGTLIGTAVNWRATFGLVAALATVTTLVLLAALPALPSRAAAPSGRAWRLLMRAPVALNLGVTVSWMAGGIAVFTYVSLLVPRVTGVGESGLSGMLMAYGIACVLGNWAGGVGADRWGSDRTAILSLVLTATALALLGGLAGVPLTSWGALVAVGLIALWGFGDWSVTAPQVQRITALEPAASDRLNALNGSAIYVGITAGAALGGVVVAHGSLAGLFAVGASLQVLALLLVLVNRRTVSRVS